MLQRNRQRCWALAAWGVLLAVLCAGCATPNAPEPESAGPARPGEGRIERLARLRDAVASQPDEAPLRYALGNALFDLGIYTEAMQHYRAAIELDPDHANAHANLGLTLRRMGQTAEALEAYERALSINPDDTVVLRNALIAAQALEDVDAVLDYTGRLLKLEPENAELEADLAALLLRLRRFEEACALYARRVAAGRAGADDFLALGQAYFYLENWDAAEDAWAAGLGADPAHGPIHRSLAVLYWTTGRYPQAWDQVRVCRQLGVPLDPDFVAALAEDSGQEPPAEEPGAPQVAIP